MRVTEDLKSALEAMARRCRTAARPMARAAAATRTAAIEGIARGLLAQRPEIESANTAELPLASVV